MRNLTFWATGLLAVGFLTATASAAPVASCASLADSSTVTATTEKDVFNNFAGTFTGLTAPPTQTSTLACLQQDKIFSNFTLQSGTLPADLGLTLDLATLGGGVDVHTVNLTSANFGSNFTLTYDLAVSGSTESVVRVTGGILNSPSVSPASLTKTVSGAGGFTGSTTTSNSSSSVINVPNLAALTVSDAFTAGSGGVTNIANSFVQSTGVPEPGTTALLGAGLLALGMISRRRAKA
jgi:opacity protein-like surface antigen